MKEFMMELHAEGKSPLYEQIYEYIRSEIYQGKLLEGEKLPSTRSLASQLQISRSTAELAYEQLRSEGYIDARPCRGYFVCPVDGLYHFKEREEEQEEPADRPGSGYDCDFSPDGIDMRYFPYNAWRKISKNILIDDRKELFSLGDPKGEPDLRRTIARYLHASRMVDCSPAQIVVGAGNDYLMMLLSKLLGERHVAMENPTYGRAYRILKSMGNRMSLIGADEGGMNVEELRACGAETAYVMPAHQYPLGIVMPIGRRTELLKWASGEKDRYLIEDDYDSEFRYRGKPIPALQSLDRNGRVIYIGTFSKAIAPAIRISYMVLPKGLLTPFEDRCACYSSTVSRIDQAILNEFILEGCFERHLNKMRTVYRSKHDLLVNGLKGAVEVSGENAGLHLLVSFKGRRTREVSEKLKTRGVRIYGLDETMILSEGTAAAKPLPREMSADSTAVMGFGGLTEEQIVRGIESLRAVL